MVPMFTCHCWIPWRSHVTAFNYYTLCFNIHQPILYILHASFYLIAAVIFDLFDLLVFYPPNNSVLQSVSTSLLFILKWCILLLMYICSVLLISAPFFLPNIRIRWSWTESQIGVFKRYSCIYIIYKDIFCVLKWRLVVYYLWSLDVTLSVK